MKRISIILLLLVSVASFHAITITSYSFDKDSYSPGDRGELKLTISLSHSVGTGESLNGFRNVLVEVSSDFASQKSIHLGDSTQNTIYVSIPLKISESTSPGVYSIPVRVSGYADVSTTAGSKSELDVSQTTAVIKVVKKPRFSVSLQPSVLAERSNVVVLLCNDGGKAREVSLSLSDDFLFSDGKLYFDEIEENSCENKSAVIESFTEGKSTMTFSISYKDAIGEESTSNVSIPVTVDKSSTTLILSHKSSIYSGKESKIVLEIKNRGKDAEEIRIRPSESINFVGESEVIVPSLSKGSSATVEEMVYTELAPGVHNIPFVVVWKEEGKEQTETINVPVKVVASDGIEVYLEAEPLPLTAGEKATLSVVVANKASFELSSISVMIGSDAFDVLEISDKKFIGSLQPDDFSSEQFKIKMKDVVGERNVSVVVEYKDPSGEIKEETIEIPINIHSQQQETDYASLILLVVVVGGGAIFYLFFYKKKREGK